MKEKENSIIKSTNYKITGSPIFAAERICIHAYSINTQTILDVNLEKLELFGEIKYIFIF